MDIQNIHVYVYIQSYDETEELHWNELNINFVYREVAAMVWLVVWLA